MSNIILLSVFLPHTREVLHYNDVTIPLTLSDVGSLENKPHPQSVPGKANKTHTHSLSQVMVALIKGSLISSKRVVFVETHFKDEY